MTKSFTILCTPTIRWPRDTSPANTLHCIVYDHTLAFKKMQAINGVISTDSADFVLREADLRTKGHCRPGGAATASRMDLF